MRLPLYQSVVVGYNFGMDENERQFLEGLLSKPRRKPDYASRFGGRYGLVHPNTEAMYPANELWFRFKQEVDFRLMLDDLYPQTIKLLDFAAKDLHFVSSLEDAAQAWEECSAKANHSKCSALLGQMRLLRAGVERWGLGALGLPTRCCTPLLRRTQTRSFGEMSMEDSATVPSPPTGGVAPTRLSRRD